LNNQIPKEWLVLCANSFSFILHNEISTIDLAFAADANNIVFSVAFLVESFTASQTLHEGLFILAFSFALAAPIFDKFR
jgi:hypothetical protein